MNDDNGRADAFVLLHTGEMYEKAANAVGTSCPACLVDPSPLSMDSMFPWLICSRGHRIRPWTDKEIEIMDKFNDL